MTDQPPPQLPPEGEAASALQSAAVAPSERPLPDRLQSEARTWAMLCHVSALTGFIGIPFGHLIGPLIFWTIKKDQFPLVDDQGKESLNFQISMLIYNVIAAVFCLVLIGFVFLAVLWVLNAVFVIVASIQASDGKFYRYPMTIRFIE